MNYIFSLFKCKKAKNSHNKNKNNYSILIFLCIEILIVIISLIIFIKTNNALSSLEFKQSQLEKSYNTSKEATEKINKDINSQITENENLTSESQEIEENIKRVMKEYTIIDEEINLLRSEIEKYPILEKKYHGSLIIRNDEEYQLLESWTSWKIQSLLYSADYSNNTKNLFSEMVMEKAPTLVLIETHYGMKFGGYSGSFWGTNNINNDNPIHLFCLSELTQYHVNRAIYEGTNNENYVLSFGKNLILFENEVEYNFPSMHNWEKIKRVEVFKMK